MARASSTSAAAAGRSAARPSAPGFGSAPQADVRLLNSVASAVFALAAAAALVAAVMWLMRSPLFPIRHIQLEGELTRNSVPTVRANAAPLLAGNFFSLNLADGRAAFETVPWVRHAVVRRVFPDTLAVRLEEHRAAALWEGSDSGAESDSEAGSDKLVNTFGEVFEANLGDVEEDQLPRLAGPEGSAAQMLALLHRLQPVFAPLKLNIERLLLSNRGSWRAELSGEVVVELGRGSDDEVVARSERFARTVADVTGRWQRPMEYADLRHADGYALRMRGVSTTAPAGKAPAAAARRH
jgi:cell division protein FtsQ